MRAPPSSSRPESPVNDDRRVAKRKRVDDDDKSSLCRLLLKRNECAALNVLGPKVRRRVARTLRKGVAAATTLVPLRLRVLTCEHPLALRMELFTLLASDDDAKARAYAEAVLSLPTRPVAFPTTADVGAFLRAAEDRMAARIIGHESAKRAVLGLLAQWAQGAKASGAPLALEGAPGIGKTTFVREALSAALGRPLVTIGLGGAADGSLLCGHGYTYEGSRPGRLATALIESKCTNPILFFDELDKLSESAKGDEVSHQLIHLCDPAQNYATRCDRFFYNVEFDMSQCMILCAYNDPTRIHPVLRDRLRIIRLEAPDEAGKLRIARTQLVPNAVARACGGDLTLTDAALTSLVRRHRAEAGVRGLKHSIECVVEAAVLCRAYGSTAVFGAVNSKRPPPPSDGVVDVDFAEHVLATATTASPTDAAPPPMMYC